MTSSDFTHVIDDVARRMTAGRAAPDVRTRVLDRLDERPRWHWRLALVPAAIALAVAAVILVRPGNRPAGVATHSTNVARVADQPRGAEQSVSRETPRDRMLPRAAENADAGRTGTPAPSSQVQALVIPALDTPAAVTIGSIQPEALEIRPLDTAPLVIPPLDGDTNQP